MRIHEIGHFIKSQHYWIDRIAEESWGRTIEKYSSQMGTTFSAKTSFISRIVRFVFCSHLVYFVKKYFLVFGCDGSIKSTPKRCITCVWLKLVVISKEPSIAYKTIVKTDREFMPKFTCERSLHCVVID